MVADKPIRVVHIQRKQGRFFSVERLFNDVRSALPSHVSVDVYHARYESLGLFRRLYDVLAVRKHQSQVNHVTGDVHYLTYLLPRRSTVLTVLDCVTLSRLKGAKKWIFWFFWYWLPLKKSRLITVISQSTKDELLRYVQRDPDDVVVIHCPVSNSFKAQAKMFDSNSPRILQIGTTANKNIERLAQALRGIHCMLVIVGELSESQKAALQENNIEYENRVGLSEAELVSEYNACDLVAFVSTYEGFGLPIVEANAVGRPVITSNVYSMPEVAGDAACIVDPYDVSRIRAGVEKMFNDAGYRQQLVEAGYQNVKRFRPATIAGQYAEVYRRVACTGS